MVKDSKTGDFGNYDFSRKNQNFEWKTTLIKIFKDNIGHGFGCVALILG